jgi:hypothetical protein
MAFFIVIALKTPNLTLYWEISGRKRRGQIMVLSWHFGLTGTITDL